MDQYMGLNIHIPSERTFGASRGQQLATELRLAQERVDRLHQQMAEQQALEERFGDLAGMPSGEAITVGIVFPEGTIVYDYLFLKHRGLWYGTGPKAPKAYSTDALLNWLSDKRVVFYARIAAYDVIWDDRKKKAAGKKWRP